MSIRRMQRVRPRAQRGAVLFIALIFLILLTLLALTSSGTAILQERMSGGMRNNQLGLMGGESALRGSEAELWGMAGRTDQLRAGLQFYCGYAGTLGSCFRKTRGQVNPLVQRFRNSPPGQLSTDGTDGRRYSRNLTALGGAVATASLAAQPRVLIEDLGEANPPLFGRQTGSDQRHASGGTNDPEKMHHYRITARSTGGSDAVNRMAESTFLALIPRSFNPDAQP